MKKGVRVLVPGLFIMSNARTLCLKNFNLILSKCVQILTDDLTNHEQQNLNYTCIQPGANRLIT